jgi:hypothetical protein
MITNYLSPVSFKVIIDRLPNIEFFTQKFTSPSISMSPVEQLSPLHRMYQTGDRLEYSEFELSFVVDENMNNYREILNWMEGLGSPENSDQFKNLQASKYGTVSDITVIVESSTRNNNLKFTFSDCFPISISGINLDVTNADVFYPEASVSVRYTNMKVENYS